jgi:hypothetical protein
MNYFRSDGWVKLVSGAAVPGAQIYVLNQPANVVLPITPPRTTPVPFVPNPQALIYSDDGLTPISQPILTDGFGHYDFYTLPGLYTVAVYFNNKLQQYYIDQSIGAIGSSGGNTVLFSTNGTPNFNQSLQNLVQGAGIVLNTDNFGNTIITSTGGGGSSLLLETNGAHNGSQSLLNLINGSYISITQDGAGNTTIAGTPSPSLPRPDAAIYSIIQCKGRAAAPQLFEDHEEINVSYNFGANYIAPTTAHGPVIQYYVWAPAFGQAGGYVASYDFNFYTGRRIVMESTTFLAYNDVALAAGGWCSGLIDSVPSGPLVDPVLGSGGGFNGNFIGVGVEKTTTVVPTYMLYVVQSGVVTSIDTGITVAIGPNQTMGIRYRFQLILASGVATLTFGSVTVSLPFAAIFNASPFWALYGRVLAGGNMTNGYEYTYTECATP